MTVRRGAAALTVRRRVRGLCAARLPRGMSSSTLPRVLPPGLPAPVFAPGVPEPPAAAWAAFAPLRAWGAAAASPSFVVRGVTVTGVDMFGPRVGFVKLLVDASLAASPGTCLPGVVFLRGGAVAVLLALVDASTGEEHAVLVAQPRLAVPCADFLEIPAGMLDGSGDVGGVAVKELAEETGIALRAAELVNLSALAAAAGGRGGAGELLPSVGACDEGLTLFFARRHASPGYLAALRGRLAGCEAEGEQIRLELAPLRTLWTLPDAKTVAAAAYVRELRAAGALVDAPADEANTLREEDLPPPRKPAA